VQTGALRATRPDVVRLAVRGYRTMAYVTGTMLCILVFVCVPLQIWGHNAKPADVVGTLHGILYIIYIVVAFTMTRAVRMKVASPSTIIVLLAGTIPILTFVVERWVRRTYIAPVLAQSDIGPSEQPVLR
jgi:integral membrane protein